MPRVTLLCCCCCCFLQVSILMCFIFFSESAGLCEIVSFICWTMMGSHEIFPMVGRAAGHVLLWELSLIGKPRPRLTWLMEWWPIRMFGSPGQCDSVSPEWRWAERERDGRSVYWDCSFGSFLFYLPLDVGSFISWNHSNNIKTTALERSECHSQEHSTDHSPWPHVKLAPHLSPYNTLPLGLSIDK